MTNYVAKVLTLSGGVIADPLPTTNITFNEVLSFPSNRRIANFSIDLIPPRGANSHYIHIYKQLDYMQRVEIYEEETVGIPVFSGFIIDQSTDLNQWGISGQETLGRLAQRRTGHYQTYPFTGLVIDMLLWILDTWQYIFFDDFTGTLASWTQVAGNWSIVSEQLKTISGGPPYRISTSLNLSTSQDDEFKIRIEFVTEEQATTWTQIFTVFWASGTFPWVLTLSHTATEDKTNFLLTQSGASDFTRDAGEYQLPFDVISSVEFYIYDGGSGQICEVWLNGRQFMLSDSTDIGFGGNLLIEIDQTGAIFDNVIIFYRDPLFLQGTIDTTPTQTIDEGLYEPPQDTYIDVLTFTADQLNFEWRTNPNISGSDSLDAAVSVGDDLSEIVRFEEGVNLTNLNLSSSGNKITTWYRFAGQGNDVNMALAEIFDKSSIDRFGFIENQLSNQRISTVELARLVASNELAKVKDGNASLTASIYTNPTIPIFRVGDEVWLKSVIPDLNQKVKIVQIDHTSGTDEKAITFSDFPRSRSGKIGQLDNDVGIINRGKSTSAAQVILQFKPGSRFIDSSDSRFIYVDSESGEVEFTPFPWIYMIKGLDPDQDPVPNFAPWNGTMNFGSDTILAVSISLVTTACRLVYHGNTNVRQCQVVIDGVNANVHDMWTSSPTSAQDFAIDFSGIDPGLHLFTFQKEASIAGSANKFISIEGLILDSYLWHDIFLEGRAINEAYLSFTLSDTVSVNKPAVRIIINDVNRTIALGGPASGFVSNQTRLDVSQYISAPGLHQIDFQLNDPVSGVTSQIDQIVEATLDVRLFV